MKIPGRLRSRVLYTLALTVAAVLALEPDTAAQAGRWVVIAWNNLGMHCMDADFGVFAILPPYNTIQAQVIDPNGRLVTTPAVRVVYSAVPDPDGSINRTSVGKSNFWQYANALFGVTLGPDQGLGANMPGPTNTPQPMTFDGSLRWFIGEGIPITPYDDAGRKNPYPMMRMSVLDQAGTVLASTSNVLPVSDEMDCSACHASGTSIAARPAAGWVFDPDPQRDYRLNILRLHDERQQANAVYVSALNARGLPKGLYRSVVEDQKPALCATCHSSNALPGTGFTGIPALTASMHAYHAHVIDPTENLPLDSSDNRSACYRCHPGSETRCLRGVMGNAVAPDGTMAIQCQNCHGSMSAVGAATRAGWLQEPTCQQCHTGTATSNNGQIRFASVFESSGAPRVAVNRTFATQADTPAPGVSLYRFSAGHGGLQCAACHGSTHAEYPASHPNDNVQSAALQGHVGTLGECSVCHTGSVPSTAGGGPHGMHPVGQAWVSAHHDAIGTAGLAQCAACHGADYRGTELSRMFGARTLSIEHVGNKSFFRGQQVGCYTCHTGPSNDNTNPNRAPVATSAQLGTSVGVPAGLRLVATDADGNPLTFRIVSQPAHGTVGLSGAQATYFPFAGYTGADQFTWAAWDGSTDSNLASVSVSVTGAPCTITLDATVPASAAVNTPVAFASSAVMANCTGTPAYAWAFGDGGTAATQNASHAYAAGGSFSWSVTASVSGVQARQAGTIAVSVAPPTVTGVTALDNPWRLQVDGTNFQVGVQVYIGTSTTPWPTVQRVSATRLVLGSGQTLRQRFPKNRPVSIRIVNPDGGSVTTTYTRR